MKKKLFKFLVAASVVTVFASFAAFAASITIEENSEIINTDTGDVRINFTSDVADTGQITALVYTPNKTNPEPVDTNIVYIDQNSRGTYSGTLSFKMKEGVIDGTECKLLMGGTDVAEAAAYEFTYEDVKPTVTVSQTGQGIAKLSTAGESGASYVTVNWNEEVELNITPAIGYYISSVEENGEEISGSFDAYKGGTYTYTASQNATFTVIFEKIESVTTDVTVSTGMTGTDALTLPEVFKGLYTMKDFQNEDKEVTVAVAFGQIEATEKTPVEWGIYLTYQDNGVPVTTKNSEIGPYFKANNKSADNQFGILFSGLKPDSYYAQTYVKYGEEDFSFGIRVPFTIDKYDPVNE